MWRNVGSLLFAGMVAGCMSVDSGPETGGARPSTGHWGKSHGPPTIPGAQGPYGTNVGIMDPTYAKGSPGSAWAAQMMMKNGGIPMSAIDFHPGGIMSPKGVPPPGMHGMGMPGPGMGMPGPGGMGMPTGNRISQANYLPGGGANGGPNGGLLNANVPPGEKLPGGVMPAQFAGTSPIGPMFPAQRTQIYFATNPPGLMQIHYDSGRLKPADPLQTPARYNFPQAAIYRLKLTHIPGHPGLELYPTLEVVPTSPKTSEFLAHNYVPLVFTEADFKQVIDRNYIVKVVYLPDPQFQDGAGAGPEEIDSRRLEPGQDPIREALSRGSLLLVIRMGNIDQEASNTPSMTAPSPRMKTPPTIGGSRQGIPGGFQVPYGAHGPIFPDGMQPTPQPTPNGADAEKKRPPLIPPQPKGDPAPPAKDLTPPVKKDDKMNGALPLPELNLDPPTETLPQPRVEPKKVENIPPTPASPMRPEVPAIPPKMDFEPAAPEFKLPVAPVEPTPSAIPEVKLPLTPVEPTPVTRPEEPKNNGGEIELPSIPLPTLPMQQGRDKISGTGTGTGSAPMLLPGAPAIPPIPESLSGSDLPPIPAIPPPEKK